MISEDFFIQVETSLIRGIRTFNGICLDNPFTDTIEISEEEFSKIFS